MLFRIFLGMVAQIRTGSSFVRRVERQRIPFMIAHHGQRLTCFDHRPRNFQRLANLRPAINEIAEEDDLAFGMLIKAVVLGVIEFP